MEGGGEQQPEVRRTEIDGIPVFHADAPGPFVGALLFRVGRADETLPTGGLTHLVEHLALHPFEKLPHAFGGFVDDTRTCFHATGTPEEVAAFLAGVCANLASLPVDRVRNERRVLRAESNSSGNVHPLWPLRFGPSGYGLLGYPEYGLHWLEGSDLQNWSDSRFTRGNAALWFTGDPPAELSIELPAGERITPPAPTTVADLDLPAWGVLGDGGVALSLLPERSTVMNVATSLFTERVQDHLRRDLGLSYAAGASYWRLDSSRAHVIVGADSTPGHGVQVRDGFMRVIDEFTGDGPDPAQLARYVSLADRYGSEPERLSQLLDTYASNELAGTDTPTQEQLSREHRELEPADIAASFSEAAEEMIVLLPPGLGLESGRAHRYRPGPEVPPVSGTDIGVGNDSVTLGEDGITQTADGVTHTILYSDCVFAALEARYAVTLIDRWGGRIWFRYVGDNFRTEVPAKVMAGLPAERVLEIDREVRDRSQGLRDLADQRIGDHKGWAVAILPYVVLDGERVVEMARATWNDQGGLLVLTDLRLFFLDDWGTQLLVELAREQVTSARAPRSLLKGSLSVSTAESEFNFSAVTRGRSGDLAELLAPA